MISPEPGFNNYGHRLYVILPLTVCGVLLMCTEFGSNVGVERSQLLLTERIEATSWGILSSDSKLSLFANALNSAGLATMLDKSRFVLVFAPTNSGMQRQGSAFLLEEVLLAEDNDLRLQLRLDNHIVENPIWPVDFAQYRNESTTVKSLSGAEIRLRLIGDKIVVGHDTFVSKMVMASNGVVFYTDNMLLVSWPDSL